ncbi:MAG: M48 family metallopeptidase [Candidatus Magasanikbacteria bacterium]|nr:M48 family metallopeptidase [Candidatus Magasanikbacteria bacterium]
MALAYTEIDSNKRNSVILMIFSIAVIIGLGYVFSMAMQDDTYTLVWVAIAISLFSTLISYYQGDKIALWSSGAKPIAKADNPEIFRLVENLAIAAGLPSPKIYIIEDPAINAFATGRKPELATIAVTTGAIQKLEKTELEGVLAHELSHIGNYDIRFEMLVAVMVGAIAIMANIFLRSRFFFGGRRSSRDEGANQIAMIFVVAGIVLAILSPLIAELIKLAVSRKREYLADASGALLTRYPAGLAGALKKIANDNLATTNASTATAHLYFTNPFKTGGFRNLFSTHPPLEERIKKLTGMAG